VTICLNGHTLTGDSNLLTISGTLTICDCVGTGKCQANTTTAGGALRMARGGTLNIYGGTFTNLKETTGGGVVVIGRDVWSATGASSSNSSSFAILNMYGGKITGGKSSGNGGNVTVYHAECTFNMYGGVIENGVAAKNGGNIYCNGKMNLLGGSITGGSAAKGDDLYLYSGTLTIGGKLAIGQIHVNGKTLKIHSSGLETETPIEIIGSGTFATDVLTDLSGCFKAATAIVYDAAEKTLKIQ
jgi:hypothetical protein